MKTQLKVLSALALAVFVSVFMGCAAQQQEYSGFINNYPPLEPGKEGVDKRYVKPGVDFGKYNKIMLDEVAFFFKRDEDYKGIKPSEIVELSEYFNKTFVDILNTSYPLTDKPGPDVMRVRVAITDLEPSNPVTGTMSTIIPVGLAYSLVKKGATGEYASIGSASMEAEFLDSESNERLGVVIDRAPGGKLDVGKLSPAESAFEFWATRLKAFLDAAHGK